MGSRGPAAPLWSVTGFGNVSPRKGVPPCPHGPKDPRSADVLTRPWTGTEGRNDHQPALAVPTSLAGFVAPAPNDLTATFPASAGIGAAARSSKPRPAIEAKEIAGVDRGMLIAGAQTKPHSWQSVGKKKARHRRASSRETDRAKPRRRIGEGSVTLPAHDCGTSGGLALVGSRGLKAVKEGDGALRMRSGREDRSLVVGEHLQ